MTLGSGPRPKVTATFFNAKYMKHGPLTKGTRVMLSGEVGYFNGHHATRPTPHFLVLDVADGRNAAAGRCKMIADASQAVSGEVLLAAFERDFFPIYPASAKLQSWDIYACVRQVLDVLDPVADPLPKTFCARTRSDVRGRGVARHPPRRERRRPASRAASGWPSTRPSGLQWALVERRHGELASPGRRRRRARTGCGRELLRRLPFELTAGQREVLDVLSDGARGDTGR